MFDSRDLFGRTKMFSSFRATSTHRQLPASEMPHKTSRRYRAMLFASMAIMASLLLGADEPTTNSDAEQAPRRATSLAPRAAYLIHVPLPITGNVDDRVRNQVELLIGQLAEMNKSESDMGAVGRPVFVFEFGGKPDPILDSTNGDDTPHDGRGSQFERSLALARFLTSDRLNGIRSVAWLPDNVLGHAVLPVIACEEIVMHPDAELGEAGVDEPFIDATTRQGYEEIARRRQTIPAPVVLGMLDRETSVTQAQLVDGGTRYLFDEEAAALERSGQILKAERIIAAGDLGRFTGRAMRLKFQWASHLAASDHDLAKAIGIPRALLLSSQMVAEGWHGVRADVKGLIHTKLVNRLQRGIEDARLDGKSNLVCLWIESPGGSVTDSMQLVRYLASLDSTQIRTVAFVPEQARADAALIALACDELVVAADAVVGGPGEGTPRASELRAVEESLHMLAEQTGRGWSLPLALVQPRVAVDVFEDKETGRLRVMSDDELAEQLEPTRWQAVRPIDTSDGLTGDTLAELQIADRVVRDEAEFLSSYGADALQPLATRWAVSSIERLAVQPWFARTLLFVAFFALISEASSPGIGVPGFVSLICFLLFFWSQFLNGTAEWLEVLLFAGGIVALVIEVFVIPGFGIFGVGGILMILASILLASQTFVIPRTAYQYDQLASSMFTVLAACAGTVTSLVVMRRLLPHAPLFNRMMLPPPDEIEVEERDRREMLVDRNYLLGKRGRTKTPLVPSGKVQFGDDVVDVVSEGDLVSVGTDVEVIRVAGNRVVVRPLA